MTEGNESLPVLGYGNNPETAKRVYILTLPEDVTAAGNDVIKVDDVHYCAENSEVSLTSEEPLEVNGQKLSKNADGTYAFTMSAANVEVEISSSDDTDTDTNNNGIKYNKAKTSATVTSAFKGHTLTADDYDSDVEKINASKISKSFTIFGNDNDNLILSGKCGDTLSGGDGDDTLTGGAGDDEITDYAEGDKISVDGAIELENVEIKLDGGSLTIDNALGKKISVSDDNGSHNYIFDTTAVYNAEKTSASLLSATKSFFAPDNMKVIDGSLTKKAELVGNGLGNSIIGGAGNDTLWGMAGNDSLYGGDGNDTVFDYANNDTIFIFGDTQPTNKFVGRNLVISTGTGSITLKDFVGSGSTNVNMLFVKTS